MKTFEERFTEFFAEQDSATQMAIYNEYAYATGHEPVNYMEEFDEVCREWNPLAIACKVRYGDFNPNHDFFTFDGYANLESIENLEWWLEDYVNDLADWYEDRARTLADVVGLDAYDLYEDEDGDEDEETEPEEENEDKGIKLGDKFQIWGSVYKVLTIDEESRSCGLIREGTTAENLGEPGATIRATFDELLSGSQYFSRMF